MASLITFSLPFQNEAVDVDIDEILDMDSDDIRRSHLFVSLVKVIYLVFFLLFSTFFFFLTESSNKFNLQTIRKGHFGKFVFKFTQEIKLLSCGYQKY